MESNSKSVSHTKISEDKSSSELAPSFSIRLPIKFTYMKVRLTLTSTSTNTDHPKAVSSDNIVRAVNESLLQLFGIVGGAIPFNVIHFFENERAAILRVDKSSSQKLWNATTLLTVFADQPCRLEVMAASGSLASLAYNSQEFFSEIISDPINMM
mmetsp:Transcript_37223/g.51661  ORF Transcript_37223/g.51661 Transcript_37223/m.51661 type:complete len:155 (+) Transcript_37223:56-520(+)